MQVEPLIDEAQGAAGHFTTDNAVLDGHLSLVFVVPNVEVRWIMVINIHVDDDSVEFAYLWHNLLRFIVLWVQKYNFFRNLVSFLALKVRNNLMAVSFQTNFLLFQIWICRKKVVTLHPKK